MCHDWWLSSWRCIPLSLLLLFHSLNRVDEVNYLVHEFPPGSLRENLLDVEDDGLHGFGWYARTRAFDGDQVAGMVR